MIFEGPNGREKIRVSGHNPISKPKELFLDYGPDDEIVAADLLEKIEKKIGKP